MIIKPHVKILPRIITGEDYVCEIIGMFICENMKDLCC